MKFRIPSFILVILFIVSAAFPALAEGDEARNITSSVSISTEGFSRTENLIDGTESQGAVSETDGTVTISHTDNIGSLYILFNNDVTRWTISSEGESKAFGTDGLLHEYIDIQGTFGNTSEITLHFPAGFDISELYVFSEGSKPDWVQVWEPPYDRADLLLYSTHSDDDQLYFAGLIPYYIAMGYRVQVAYFTYHPASVYRRHELLNGLWTAGERHYPIYGKFADFRIDDLDETVAEYAVRGVEYDELREFVIETTRRVKPLVVVSHDPLGEYGHGMHRLLSKIVRESVDICPDETQYTASAREYGVWTVPKTYLHLYDDNKLVLNIDSPLDYYGGKTAFQVSQEAFEKHISQFWLRFHEWLYGTDDAPITKAAQIETYNPAYYGLYASTVGEDTGMNDMFENLSSYGDMQSELEERDELIGEQEAELKKREKELDRAKRELDDMKKTVSRLVYAIVIIALLTVVCIVIWIIRMKNSR